MAAVGAALGERIELHQSFTRFVLAREHVRLEQSGALNLIARDVEVGPRSGVVFLIAKDVHGDVRPAFDWRGAVAFGVAFGATLAVVRAIFRR